MSQNRREEAAELATRLATGAITVEELNEHELGLYHEFRELMDLAKAAYSGEVPAAPWYPKPDLSFLIPEALRRLISRKNRNRRRGPRD